MRRPQQQGAAAQPAAAETGEAYRPGLALFDLRQHHRPTLPLYLPSARNAAMADTPTASSFDSRAPDLEKLAGDGTERKTPPGPRREKVRLPLRRILRLRPPSPDDAGGVPLSSQLADPLVLPFSPLPCSSLSLPFPCSPARPTPGPRPQITPGVAVADAENVDDVFVKTAGGPDYRSVSWIGALVLLLKTQIGLGGALLLFPLGWLAERSASGCAWARGRPDASSLACARARVLFTSTLRPSTDASFPSVRQSCRSPTS